MKSAVIVLVLLSTACAKETSVAGAPDEPTAAASPTLPTAPVEPAPKLSGKFISTSCGPSGREYPRELIVRADGTFRALDLVSPCPEGANCAWSGIIETKGTFTLSGDELELQPKDGAAHADQRVAFGTSFWVEEDHLLSRNTKMGCRYDRSDEY